MNPHSHHGLFSLLGFCSVKPRRLDVQLLEISVVERLEKRVGLLLWNGHVHLDDELLSQPYHLRVRDVPSLAGNVAGELGHHSRSVLPRRRDADVIQVQVHLDRCRVEGVQALHKDLVGGVGDDAARHFVRVDRVPAPHGGQHTGPQQRDAGRERDAHVHRHKGKVYQRRGDPDLPEGDHVLVDVVLVLLHDAAPIGLAVVALAAHDEFFRGVKRREVHEWMVDALIQEHLQSKVPDSLDVLDLLLQWLGGKLRSVREYPAENRNVDRVLDTAQIDEPKGCKGCVSPPINFLLLVHNLLDQQIHEARLDSRQDHPKRQGMLGGNIPRSGPESTGGRGGSGGKSSSVGTANNRR
mmetsp:Transcript_14697/g.40885  ORF Transcript_14697/g.40885 Transcript_14697/m.40885 type:complete len:353 (+) Transcript_14697:2086-3144(+)